MNYYGNIFEKRDTKRIDKLNTIQNVDGCWDKVRKFTKNVSSDSSLSRWQILAEKRYEELKNQTNN